jgi:alkanesulfonate monooxygenase SsuD/methylene tetrahydromethanopterin reductase-like flavin-dependent oxidoreductase (luciferase family)
MKLGMFFSPGAPPDKPLAEVIEWYHKLVRRAEELGYEEAWMASHTMSRWARVACPRHFIARCLADTRRIRLGTAVEILYQQHPITLAAQLGELDQVAQGRMLFGFGAGGPLADLRSYALPGDSVGEMGRSAYFMMLEAIEIIRNCWQEGGPQDFEGRFWKVRRAQELQDGANYAWHLKPYGPWEDRVAFAGFAGNSGALRLAGAEGYMPLSWSVSSEFAHLQWQALEDGAQSRGRRANRQRWRQVQVMYAAESEADARKAIATGFAATFWEQYWVPIFEKTGVMEYLQRRSGITSRKLTVEDLIDLGIWFVGRPDKIAEQIRRQNDEFGGFGTLLQAGFDYSGAGEEGWMRSMELIATEVMPAVNGIEEPEGASAS